MQPPPQFSQTASEENGSGDDHTNSYIPHVHQQFCQLQLFKLNETFQEIAIGEE